MGETFWRVLIGAVLIAIGVVGLLNLDRLVALVKRSRRSMWGDTRTGDRNVRAASRTSQGGALVVFIVLGVVMVVTALGR